MHDRDDNIHYDRNYDHDDDDHDDEDHDNYYLYHRYYYSIQSQLYEQIKNIWRAVVQAALPFLQHQHHQHHQHHNFEFFGIDVIADTNHKCWLIEVNRQV